MLYPIRGIFRAGLLSLLIVFSVSAQEALNSQVDSVFSAYDRPGSPGCVLGVIRDGRLIYGRGYGLANLEHNLPLTTKSVLDIGSTSKQFTAAAIVLLAQNGKLSLDDDVRKYVPELPDYGKTITIRHLLNHTSGLRDYLTLFSLAGVDFDGVTNDDDALRIIQRQKALNFPPNEEYLYSNSGFFLLSVIVKRVSGKSLRAFAQEQIFGPLGMTSTHFHDDHTEIVPLRATAYAPRETGFRIDMSLFEQTGDGAVMTSVEDLMKWDSNFYEPKVGGRAMWDALLTRGKLNNGEVLDYALGLRLEEYKGLKAISHGGSWAGYRAEMIRFPEEKFTVICLCNLASTNPTQLAHKVADIYLADRLKAAEKPSGESGPAQPIVLTAEQLKRFVGLYRNPVTGALRRLSLKDGKLFADSLVGPSLEAVPLAADLLRVQGASGKVELQLLPAPPGGKAKLVVRREGSKPETLEAIDAASPSARQLAEYAGTYASDELDATYRLALKGERLVLSIRGASERELKPTFRDGFVTPEGVQLEFRRDARGKITGFSVQAGRVRNIGFARLP